MQEAWGRTEHYAENDQPEYKGTEQQRLKLKTIADKRLKPFEPTKNESKNECPQEELLVNFKLKLVLKQDIQVLHNAK